MAAIPEEARFKFAGEGHKPRCMGCGADKGLLFFPRHGLFLCQPCADRIAQILRACEGGLTVKDLEFKLGVIEEKEG